MLDGLGIPVPLDGCKCALRIAYLRAYVNCASTPCRSREILYGVPPSLLRVLAIFSRDFVFEHTATMHPPPPAPVSLAPSAPARFAAVTSLSSFGCETPILWRSS